MIPMLTDERRAAKSSAVAVAPPKPRRGWHAQPLLVTALLALISTAAVTMWLSQGRMAAGRQHDARGDTPLQVHNVCAKMEQC